MQRNSYISKAILKLLVVLIFMGTGKPVLGQASISFHPSTKKMDTASFASALKNGSWKTGWRYYFMATDNDRRLTDYYAHAMGAHVKYETGEFKKFRLGIDASLTGKILSTDLSVPDSLTSKGSRYEVGLFDMEDLKAPTLVRLEELYLAYHNKDLTVTAGRQLLNTPFINLQDGRMRPTAVSGIWIKNTGSKTLVEGGFINSFLPRSTGRWFGVGSSIGLYPQGMSQNGEPADFAGHLHSGGIILMGASHSFHPAFRIQVWNQLVLNIFNTILFQAELKQKTDSLPGITAGLQIITQQRMANGGNDDSEHDYFEKNNHPLTISTRLGWGDLHWSFSLNYTRITRSGQYLMPKEWGKDPFYTFLPRERNSGYGDLNAWVARLSFSEPKTAYNFSLDGGYFRMPDVEDYRLNRYGMPSYYQLNAELKHRFKKWPRGLDMQLLYVYKKQAGQQKLDDKYVFNKVNMSSYNVVFNYSL